MNDLCNNCRRCNVAVSFVAWDSIKRKTRKKFFLLSKPSQECGPIGYDMCENCRQYMLDPKPQWSNYWPAFVWSFLTLDRVVYDSVLVMPSMQDRWALIPMQWRLWWIQEIRKLDHRLTLFDPAALIVDASDQYYRFNEIEKTNRWNEWKSVLDETLAFPSVRCPFGCSEYLHRIGRLPLEDFILKKSNYCLESYARKDKSWADVCRPDWPLSCVVAENKAFVCQPMFVMDELSGSPFVACCRYHQVMSCKPLRMLHCPVNPTGSLYTEASNQFAPVRLQCRTVRMAKQKEYSDCYVAVELKGAYNGLDSCYLCESRRYDLANELSEARDMIEAAGRDDIHNFMMRCGENRHASYFFPSDVMIEKLQRSYEVGEALDHDFYRTKQPNCTFISSEEALDLQESIWSESSRSLNRYDSDGHCEPVLTTKLWPSMLVHVHPNDDYGEKFVRVPNRFNGCRLEPWVLLSMLMHVPEIWKATCKLVRDNKAWFGWYLSLAAAIMHQQGNRSDLFRCSKDDMVLLEKIGIDSAKADVDFKRLCPLWTESTFILSITTNGLHVLPDMEGKVVAIVIYDADAEEPGLFEPCYEQRSWELRMLIVQDDSNSKRDNCKIYVRHKGFCGWWVSSSHSSCPFRKCHSLPSCQSDWEVAVYVRKDTANDIIRRRFRTCFDFQDVFYCFFHRLPLIFDAVNRRDKSKQCVECSNHRCYVCAFDGCKIGVCKQHFSFYQGIKQDQIVQVYEDRCVVASRAWLKSAMAESSEDENSDGGTDESTIELDFDTDFPCVSLDMMGDDLCSNDVLSVQTDLSEDKPNNDREKVDDPVLVGLVTNANDDNEPFEISLEHVPEGVGSSPLHVLLNTIGHALIREKGKVKMSYRACQFWQKVAAMNDGGTIPLLYAEGLVFPDLFFYSDIGGSIYGAIPTALITDEETLSGIMISSLRDHFRTRIFDPSLLASADPRYHFFAFDCLVNLGMRGYDSRMILHRGFADIQDVDRIQIRKSDDGEIYGDPIENFSSVYKLAASVACQPPHYFYTKTLNQYRCLGVRMMRNWVTSDEATKQVAHRHNLSVGVASKSLRESVASFIQRSWDEFIDIWFRYIVQSPEMPIGHIKQAWGRREFQSKNGQPSHLHCLFTTTGNEWNQNDYEEMVDRIRGCVSDVIRVNEIDDLIARGDLLCKEEVYDVQDDAKKFLRHRCNDRCQIPVDRADSSQGTKCKVPNVFHLSPTPEISTMVEFERKYSPDAQCILQRLGIVDHPLLRACRHFPGSSKEDSPMSPILANLFVKERCQSNAQYVTGLLILAYITKYISGFDENSRIHIQKTMKGQEEKPTKWPASMELLNNTKIASNKSKASKSLQQPLSGRPLSQMEALTVIGGTPLVMTNIEFIHIPTSPKEYRVAFRTGRGLPDRFSKRRPPDGGSNQVVASDTIRRKLAFPTERLFTSSQILLIRDELLSALTQDAITIFSARPPELFWIRDIKLYYTFFSRSRPKAFSDSIDKQLNYLHDKICRPLDECSWIDGFTSRIRLRAAAIWPCLEYAKSAPLSHFQNNANHKRAIVSLFEEIFRYYQICHEGVSVYRPLRSRKERWRSIQDTFLCELDRTILPVPWHTPVHPVRESRWMFHVLFALGRITTELDLMTSGNIRQAFVSAELFQPERGSASVDDILRRYVLEMLRLVPGSTYQFSTSLSNASAVLYNYLLGFEFNIGIPSVLSSQIMTETNQAIIDFRHERLKNFTEVLRAALRSCGIEESLPSTEVVLAARTNALTDARTKFFPPRMARYQSFDSFAKQQEVCIFAKSQALKYLDPSQSHKNFIVVGGPGTGKTAILQISALYYLSKGMYGTITTDVAERAKVLGGEHVHLLFKLPCRNETTSSIFRTAQSAATEIFRNPPLLAYLRSIDFLFGDEFGLWSAHRFAVVDSILRLVRGNNKYFGGILVFGTMDIHQLLPFTGIPFLMSTHAITDFAYFRLKDSVRAAQDPPFQRLQMKMTTQIWTREILAQVREWISNLFTFVPSFNDPLVTSDCVFVFGKRAPCVRAEKLAMSKIRQSGQPFFVAEANDSESTLSTQWFPASASVTKSLSRAIKQRKELYFYKKAKYEFTHNEKGKFSQGQLAIMVDLPVDEDVSNKAPVTVYAAPPGTKDFPPDADMTVSKLKEQHWYPVSVKYSESPKHRLRGGVYGKRQQYGLRPRIASTIHACMGSTLSKVVTCVVAPADENAKYDDYGLWEAAQVIVLCSRTRFARNLIFVGDKEKTIDHLMSVLQMPNRFMSRIEATLNAMCDHHSVPTVQNPTVFRCKDAIVPQTPSVYLLLSTQCHSCYYIGSTQNTSLRLLQHNTNKGSEITNRRELQPWAMLAYIVGFENRHERRVFEQTWQCNAREIRRKKNIHIHLLEKAKQLATNYRKSTGVELTIILCGEIISSSCSTIEE